MPSPAAREPQALCCGEEDGELGAHRGRGSSGRADTRLPSLAASPVAVPAAGIRGQPWGSASPPRPGCGLVLGRCLLPRRRCSAPWPGCEQFPCTQQLPAQSLLATEIMQQNRSSCRLPAAWKCLESFKSRKMLSFPSFSLLPLPLAVCALDPPLSRGARCFLRQTVTNSEWRRLPASCSGRQAAGALPARVGLRVTHRHAACDYKGECRPLLFCTGICVSWGYFDLSCALSAHEEGKECSHVANLPATGTGTIFPGAKSRGFGYCN